MDEAANIGWPHLTFQGKQPGPYGDLRAMNDTLHARGFRVLSYNSPDFHPDRPSYIFPAEQDFLVKGPDGQPYVHPGFRLSWLDFTNPRAVAWWGLLWRRNLTEPGA